MNPKKEKKGKANRKVVLVTLTLSLVAIMLIGITVAYLTDMRSVLNFIGIGSGLDENGDPKQAVMVSLTEPSFVKKAKAISNDNVEFLSGSTTEVTKAIVESLLPGDKIYKDPTITNAGLEPLYVRVKMDVDSTTMGLLTELGLSINSSFQKHTDDYYYYVSAPATLTTLAKDASVEFFVTTADDDDKYSMTIPATWGNAKLAELLGSSGAKLFELPITVEVIQGRGFTPGAGLGWEGVNASDIVAVTAANRNPVTTP